MKYVTERLLELRFLLQDYPGRPRPAAPEPPPRRKRRRKGRAKVAIQDVSDGKL